jgi:predicted nucleotidyltransferase
MKICGIVVEYNPLHKGHIYHIQQAKSITNCDYVVAVMSGNFVQRGEPAVINKWSRTESALLSGIDLVIELPLIYSISSAEGFSFGAISILNSLGIIDSICFGSECGDITF